MAPKGTAMGLALFLVVVLWNGAAAQSGCTSVLMTLAPCLNYVTGNSSTPSSSCCSSLSNVVQSNPRCLCSLLNAGGSSIGVTVNQTLALGLPGACNVPTPPLSRCNAASAPTSSAATPESAPVGSPAESPESAPVGSPAESPESDPVGSPSPADSPSDSSSITLPENLPEPSESSNPSAGAGSKTVPSTAGASSGGSTIKSPLLVAVFLLFIVSCASSATIF